MTVLDLIMLLSELPEGMEVVYDVTRDGDTEFTFVSVSDIEEIITDDGTSLALLNPSEVGEEEDDEDEI
jgi:hypothetical protein